MTPEAHRPVLLDEVLAALAPRPGETIVDGTFGAGGYSRAILSAGARVIAIDRDPSAVARGRELARAEPRLTMLEGRFGGLDRLASDVGRSSVDGVVLDIGVSSMQLDEAERGFSFRRDGPLDMRMGGDGPSAADLVATLPEAALADILFRYGEERRSRRIAAAIVRRRTERPITRTADLAELVAGIVGRSWKDRIDPATRSFQALRIAVNRELEELALGLSAAEQALKPGGRIVVVTFHSLEDRIAKQFIAERSRVAQGSRHAPAVAGPPPSFAPITRKAVQPSEIEAQANPRARSAKLRAARRTDAAPIPLDLRELGVPTLEDLTWGGRR